MTTYDRIARILIGPMGIDGARVTPAATAQDLKLDSLDIIDFAIEMEIEFGILVYDHHFAMVSTLAELADTIDALIAKRAA